MKQTFNKVKKVVYKVRTKKYEVYFNIDGSKVTLYLRAKNGEEAVTRALEEVDKYALLTGVKRVG